MDLVTRIMSTHHPDIPDLFALISALLNEEEHHQVMAKSYEAFTKWRRTYIQAQPRGDNVPQLPTAEEILCLNPPAPANDLNTEFGQQMIEGAQQGIREGLKGGGGAPGGKLPKGLQYCADPRGEPSGILNPAERCLMPPH